MNNVKLFIAGICTCFVSTASASTLSNSDESNNLNVINVVDFGIFPDDGIDDTKEFESLIQQLKTGDVVKFPSGEFDFYKEVKFNHSFPDGVKIQGTGNTFIRKTGNYKYATPYSGSYVWSFENPKGLIIEGFNFKGYRTKLNSVDSGFFFNGGSDVLIESNKFSGFNDDCISISALEYDSEGLNFENNEFYECVAINRSQEDDEEASINKIKIAGNTFVANSNSIVLKSNVINRFVTISNNYFFNNTADTITSQSYDALEVTGNYFFSGNRAAVNVIPSSFGEKENFYSMVFDSNTIVDHRYGLKLKPYDQNDVSYPLVNPMYELVVSNNHFDGLYFDTKSNGANDYFYQAIRFNLYAKGSYKNITLDGNTFSNTYHDEKNNSQIVVGEMMDETMVKAVAADIKNGFIKEEDPGLFIGDNVTLPNIPSSLQSGSKLPLKEIPSFPLSNVFWTINWDNSWPDDTEFEVLENKPIDYSVRTVAGQYARRGWFAGEFNLKSFDDFTDNLVRGSYRSEIVGPVSKEKNYERWYSFSSRLPGNYNYSQGQESIFQVHTYPSDGQWSRKISTPYALMTDAGRYTFFVSGTAEHSPIPMVKKHYIDLGEYEKNTWVDWVFQVKHDTKNGFVKIWKNGELAAEYNGPVGYHEDSSNHWTYPKWGLYRWSWADYQHITSRKVFIDEMKVGSEGATYEMMRP
ncbi:heparin lyase I family protein [Motilimonas pumila]|uniref:Right handed beta helix domain-containing protein n=1 Tax=Motilimonas pumila TaxID=2303987 RepID=A0A418Y9S7_9GAMM|nr:heparin lyase I family protein [Motilimonas pumila]RJG38263.1 hypothetical protein D1Z90_19125 [Motilimonas pumila]